MKNRFKFRGQRKTDKTLVYGQLRYATGKDAGKVFIFNEIGLYEIIEGTESQFTGLKDKNGKDIYEGDIGVRNMEATFQGKPHFHCDYWAVMFHEGAFVTVLKGDKPSRYSARFKEIEVIGNIYENPNLLK